VTKSQIEQDYDLVEEMGCTSVRLAHYPHSTAALDQCDKRGFVTWSELAVVNKVSDTPEFVRNARRQLRELIKQQFNHPSFLLLSVYNEPWIDKVKGDGEWRVIETLAKDAKALAPGKLVTGAMNWGPNFWLTWAGDLGSFNHYWGWYDGTIAEWPARLEKIRTEAGGRSFGMSEYGAGASIIQHEVPPKQPVAPSRWHPEEWQSTFHEGVWPALAERDWIWCKYVWVMFDFASDGRNEGDTPGVNDKGIVTADRKTRKDAFYYYKAQWSKTPFVHITSRRFSPRPAGETTVRVYSNCDSVSLSLNGGSLGKMRRLAPGVFEFAGINLRPGDARVEVTGLSGNKNFVDRCTWKVVGGTVIPNSEKL
jgi:beta-galactosidase